MKLTIEQAENIQNIIKAYEEIMSLKINTLKVQNKFMNLAYRKEAFNKLQPVLKPQIPKSFKEVFNKLILTPKLKNAMILFSS